MEGGFRKREVSIRGAFEKDVRKAFENEARTAFENELGRHLKIKHVGHLKNEASLIASLTHLVHRDHAVVLSEGRHPLLISLLERLVQGPDLPHLREVFNAAQ